MSLSLVLRTQDDRVIEPSGGELLMAELERLDELAVQAGLRPIASWADDREIPEDFDGDPDELEELMGPNPIWHTSPEALAQWRELQALLTDPADEALGAALSELADLLQRESPETFQLDVLF